MRNWISIWLSENTHDMTLHKSRVFFFYFYFSRKKRIFHSRRTFGCAPFHLQMKMRSSRDHYRGKSQLWKWRAKLKLKRILENSTFIQSVLKRLSLRFKIMAQFLLDAKRINLKELWTRCKVYAGELPRKLHPVLHSIVR